MMVTDIIRDEVTYDNIDGWSSKEADMSASEKEEYHKKQLEKYNNSKKRFTFFPAGIFITAYARRAVMAAALEFAEDYCYIDTDAIKGLHPEKHIEWIRNYNALCEEKLIAMCKHYNIDYSRLKPKTIKGEEKPLGVFEYEGTYEKAKFIGAKRYMTYKDGELSITVSGINKHEAVPYLKENFDIDTCFNNFHEGMIVPPEYTGKLTHYYLDTPYRGTVTDYNGVSYEYEMLSGVYLEEAAYVFSPMEEYIRFLKGYFYTL